MLRSSCVRRGGANAGRNLWCEDEQRFPFGTQREPQGGLRRGEDKHQALRESQLEMRERVKKRYGEDRPRLWGAFVLVGE